MRNGFNCTMRIVPVVLVTLWIIGCVSSDLGVKKLITIDGNGLEFKKSPGPTPTVVFEAGLGDGMETWDPIFNQVAKFSAAFSYSRPGYSRGPHQIEIGGKRTARESAQLLFQALTQARVTQPYILVGHSIGGLYMLEFARMYPETVAGMVLIDARLPGFTQSCERGGHRPCKPPSHIAQVAPHHIGNELRGIEQSEAEAPSPEQLGNYPVRLLVASKPATGAPSTAQPIWIEEQHRYANGLHQGRVVVVKGAGHYIHKDAPGDVISEIGNMVHEIR